MKVLMVTQKVAPDDPILGFVCEWIKALSRRLEKLTVVTLEHRGGDWPANVEIYSLGKEKNLGRLIRLGRFFQFANTRLAQDDYDLVFCHMSPKYLVFLSPWAKALAIPLTLWYAHGQVSFTLKTASRLANRIFTSTAQGYRLPSGKVSVVGQGIPIAQFDFTDSPDKGEQTKIVTIGRISPRKDLLTFLKAAAEIINRRLIGKPRFYLVGGIITPGDEPYLKRLRDFCRENNLEKQIDFIPACSPQDVLKWYCSGDIFVNTSKTGSLDKVILEAMAAGKPIITSNQAGVRLLEAVHQDLIFPEGDYQSLAQRIYSLTKINDESLKKLTAKLRYLVAQEHSLERLADRLVQEFRAITDGKTDQ